ncbi:hypothetical protein [Dryocola sp. BD613]|uniref:hypothetical protein n=1 Tax=Dryocola sp. BD613 TaxID=3133272 RepID=UPI003F50B334
MMTNTTPAVTNPSPVYMTLDLFELLEICETLADELIECPNPARQQVLYMRLADYLEAMELELEKPLPPYLIERLTVETLIHTHPQHIAGDSELLRQYCCALTRVLRNCSLSSEVRLALNGLLFELVNMLIEDLLAPRFAKVN